LPQGIKKFHAEHDKKTGAVYGGAAVYGACLFVMFGMKFIDALRQQSRD